MALLHSEHVILSADWPTTEETWCGKAY